MGPPAVLKREPYFRPANWLWQWFLTRYDFWAVPMPWRVVHIRHDVYRPSKLLDVLVQHERVHYEQQERVGIVLWHIKYFWFLLLHGYRNNVYEVEAYSRYGGNPQDWKEVA